MQYVGIQIQLELLQVAVAFSGISQLLPPNLNGFQTKLHVHNILS